mmetsp:Transcript_29191/g.74904  ORF Transcript_29191/g.74904 Transcript_29191/m.74904 type:complete len:747 (-) Transcript_29191:500-2740(-)|eukprot:jgi/Tetstr1/453839/TSEL_004002.t1
MERTESGTPAMADTSEDTMQRVLSVRPGIKKVRQAIQDIMNSQKDEHQVFRIKSRIASKAGGGLEEQKKKLIQMLENQTLENMRSIGEGDEEEGDEESAAFPSKGSKLSKLKYAKPVVLEEEDDLTPVPHCMGLVKADLKFQFDLTIVGGGPTGVQAALKAAYAGKRVLLIDCPSNGTDADTNPLFGGPTGLFSKALRDVGKQLNVVMLRNMRIHDDAIWMQVGAMITELALSNSLDAVRQLKDFGVSLLTGWATFEKCSDCGNSTILSVAVKDMPEPLKVDSNKVLLATGSSAILADKYRRYKRVFDSDTINRLSFLPRSIVIQGGGIIALEFAKIFLRLDCDVTVLIRGDAAKSLVAKGLDPTIAALLIRDLEESGITVMMDTLLDDVQAPRGDDGPLRCVVTKGGEQQVLPEADAVMIALGRKPNTAGMGLEEVGIELTARKEVKVNASLQTSLKSIYAAGDVLGPPSLASTGIEQAARAIEEMFDPDHASAHEDSADGCMTNKFVDPNALVSNPFSFPIGVWTNPEVAYFGMTLSQAVAAGYDQADEGMAAYSECIRGRVFAPKGMVKLIFDKNTGIILGVHIIGQDACELIHYGMELVVQQKTIFVVMDTIFTAVTFHELYKLASIDGHRKLQLGIKWQSTLQNMVKFLEESGITTLNIQKLHSRASAQDLQYCPEPGRYSFEGVKIIFEKAAGVELPDKLATQIIKVGDVEAAECVDQHEFGTLVGLAWKRLSLKQSSGK